jgi:transposase-like protein
MPALTLSPMIPRSNCAQPAEIANIASPIAVVVAMYKAKYPKATECLQKDRDALLAFYEFPAEH